MFYGGCADNAAPTTQANGHGYKSWPGLAEGARNSQLRGFGAWNEQLLWEKIYLLVYWGTPCKACVFGVDWGAADLLHNRVGFWRLHGAWKKDLRRRAMNSGAPFPSLRFFFFIFSPCLTKFLVDDTLPSLLDFLFQVFVQDPCLKT